MRYSLAGKRLKHYLSALMLLLMREAEGQGGTAGQWTGAAVNFIWTDGNNWTPVGNVPGGTSQGAQGDATFTAPTGGEIKIPTPYYLESISLASVVTEGVALIFNPEAGPGNLILSSEDNNPGIYMTGNGYANSMVFNTGFELYDPTLSPANAFGVDIGSMCTCTITGSISNIQRTLTFPFDIEFTGPSDSTLVLTGANALKRPIQVGASATSPTLQGNTQSLQVDISNGGVVIFDQSVVGSGTYSGSIYDDSHPGHVTIRNGAVIFTGTNTYTGGTAVNAGGTLQGNTNAVQGIIQNDGSLIFDQSTIVRGFYSDVISGIGSVEIQGGKVSVTGMNTYTGGTTIASDAAFEVLNSGSYHGAITGPVVVNGEFLITDTSGVTINSLSGSGNVFIGAQTLTVSDSSSAISTIFSGEIIDNNLGGGLIKGGASTLILTGFNSYLGATTVSGGILQGSTDSFAGNIDNDALLIFDQSMTISNTYSNTISGNGTVEIQGGVLVLSSGNTYTGATIVDSGGTLSVTGSLANTAVTVNAGGTLQGTGTIGSGGASIVNNGTVSPGTSPGMLTIDGSYTQNAGGAFDVEIASATSYSQLIATGDIVLNGPLSITLSPHFSGFTTGGQDITYTLMEGASVTGGFSPIQVSFPALSTFGLFYEQDQVLLTLYVPYPPSLSSNAVAHAAPIVSATYQRVYNFSRRLNKFRSVWQSGSELLSAGANAPADEWLIASAGDGFVANVESPTTRIWIEPSRRKTWGVFADAVGGIGRSYRTATQEPFKIDSVGGEIGFDYVGEWFGAGFSPSYQLLSGISDAGDQKYRVYSAAATAFATLVPMENKSLFIDVIGGGGYQWYRTLKKTPVGDVRGSTQGEQFYVYSDVGYAVNYSHSKGLFSPFLGLGYIGTFIDSYQEKGNIEQAFHIGENNGRSLRTSLGFSSSYTFSWNWFSFIPEARAIWQYECLPQNQSVAYASAPLEISSQIQVLGTGKNTVFAGAFFRFEFPKKIEFYGSYDYEWNTQFHKHLFFAGLDQRF